MAEPKKKLTRTRKGNRRSHLAKQARSLRPCPKCRELILPHRVCSNCGTYNGKVIIKEKKDHKK